MSFNLILVTQPAYRSRSSHETLEAIMSLALFDIEHKVVFFEQGLTWLTANQLSSQTKSIEKQINALPMYDSDELYYVVDHLKSVLGENQVNSLVEPVDLATLSTWFKQAKHVEIF